MAEVINMPRLSDTMEEGTVAKWLKQEGDKIEEGDILAEIETDKATMEFESFYEGTLLHIGIQEGDSAPVDQLLAIIGDEGEDIDALIKGNDAETSDSEKDSAEEKTTDAEATDNNASDSDVAPIPEGVEVVNMPRLSDTMEEGTVATWNKQEGDDVEEGDILAEIETDKATMEFESFYNGVLLYIGIKEGESAPVDDVLAIIGPKGTDVDQVLASLKSDSSGDSSQSDKKESSDKKETTDKASEAEDNTSASTEKQHEGRDGKRIFASPLAKRIAADKGIDLTAVKGSGDNGRIVKKDIENYKPSTKPAATSATAEPTAESTAAKPYVPAGEEAFEEVKNSQMRKTIAKRLGESKYTAPHYYLTIEVDMDNAMTSRKAINALPDTKVSFNDLVIKASAMALRKHPRVNSQWDGNVTKIAKHIHIGAAVAVEDGLVVPVLRFADQQSMTQIGANVKEYAKKARNKKLQPDDMEGSTFTVSNLGMFGIEDFTSIINQPNSAILSVGKIAEKPVVKNGEIVVGHTMKLTLACDHRTVDGATGAKFLQTLQAYLENPVTMLA